MSTPLQPIVPTQAAEWLPARVVLLCEPNIETLFGLLQTDSNNFPFPYALSSGRAEHQAYRRALEAGGARVIDIREALALAPRGRLESWATQAIDIVPDDSMQPDDIASSHGQLARALAAFDIESLVHLIMLRPRLCVGINPGGVDPTTRYRTHYEVRPADSAYYTRDPLITTARGCVITRLMLDIRAPENDVMAHVLEALGIAPLYRVLAPGTLEGGDFIPCGDFVLQGQGLLTNAEGVRQCLEHGVYGFTEVAVVIDPRNNMDEMHLDTYFAMLDKDLAACVDTRLCGEEEPHIQVWTPVGTPTDYTYTLGRTLLFSAYLEEKGITVIPFSKREQDDFAANGLLVGPRKLIGVTRAGAAYEARLRSLGVDTNFIGFDALTGGYGGPHCSSQVLVRAA
jgi:arginine deiminase